ncbi:hypothetical protein C5S53_12335 [Methanophagales archaeon]|nr:hypothetical protein C5S53_12335 [Methanophagales archaeon]
MKVNTLFSVFAIVLLLSLAIGIASAADVLKIDERRSYVRTVEGEQIPYTDFLNTDQFEGEVLEFHIYVDKTGVPIPDNYVLELRTNLEKPRDWRLGDDIYHSASVIVWQGKDEHAYPFPSPIRLTGVVPEPIKQVKEPGFEKYNIEGIGKDDVFVELTVGTSRSGDSLETIQQKLSPPMVFYSTDRGIQDAERTINDSLGAANAKVGETTKMEQDIEGLYEGGHPGWASKLAEDYNELASTIEAPPVALYVVISVMLGLILGSAFVYVYVSRGGGKGVDISQISSELDDTSERITEKSSSINALSTKFARSEDAEKRSMARELVRLRASLNEISNEIRTISDKIRGVK